MITKRIISHMTHFMIFHYHALFLRK